MTVVVTDLDEARRFFGLLGFVERIAVVASGEVIARYMGIPGLGGRPRDPRARGRARAPGGPAAPVPPAGGRAWTTGAGTLTRTGFNHVCFRVNDLDAMLAHLAEHGVKPRNEVFDFHDRRLVFLDGPGVVVELAEWVSG